MKFLRHFSAIDISKFRDLNAFKSDVTKILQGFRDSKKDPKYGGRIYTAGEPEHLAWAKRPTTGTRAAIAASDGWLRGLLSGCSVSKKYEKFLFWCKNVL